MRRIAYPFLNADRRARALRAVCALAATAAAAGCSVGAELVGAPNVPESEYVQNTPWPRLADGPAPEPVDPTVAGNVGEQIAAGAEVNRALNERGRALRETAQQLQGAPVVVANNATRAARLRREAARMLARP